MRIQMIIAVAGAALLAVAAPALGHSRLVRTSPAAGSTARPSLAAVTVTFGGPLRSGTVTVVGPGRKVFSKGRGGSDPRDITRLLVGLRPLKPGGYTVVWTSVAADGHGQRGTFAFRVAR